ncbi:MAG: ABC transporter permease [Lachnospiraceae bacterium]|nr:ABC transporter permease [Lachnospiraceae bacterium]
MNQNVQTKRVIHLVKRGSISRGKAWCIRLIAILLSLVVCGIVINRITGENPVGVYGGILSGAVGTKRRIWVTVRETMTLLIIAVGLTPAFKMRFWNLGAEGQILIGGAATAAVMIYLGPLLMDWLLIPIIIVASLIAGMLWGLLPAIFKARLNTNESLFTLMMNYVAMQIVTFCVVLWESPKGSNSVGIINQTDRAGWFPNLLGSDYTLNVVLTVIVTILIFVYMRQSKQGYELSVVGASQDTARYAGINVRRVIVRTMMISSAICGLAGAIIVAGSSHTISTTTAGGRGFTAIIVAWLSQFNPIAMVMAAAFLVFMQQGSIQIASQYGLNNNASDIITGILLFFLIGCEFFVRYKLEVSTVQIGDSVGKSVEGSGKEAQA